MIFWTQIDQLLIPDLFIEFLFHHWVGLEPISLGLWPLVLIQWHCHFDTVFPIVIAMHSSLMIASYFQYHSPKSFLTPVHSSGFLVIGIHQSHQAVSVTIPGYGTALRWHLWSIAGTCISAQIQIPFRILPAPNSRLIPPVHYPLCHPLLRHSLWGPVYLRLAWAIPLCYFRSELARSAWDPAP